ncbi:MAG: AMP-binding protein, partial [Candidatus Hodarchaeales archaeon]
MESNFTPKERAAYDRYLLELKKLEDNPNQSVGIYIEQFAEKTPDKIVLYFEDNSWTYKEFNEESNLYANFFLEKGLKPGDRIALVMENSPEYLFITTGINKIQGINALVNINQRGQA